MGAEQSSNTKNTFINVDTRDIEFDFATDTRKIQSWHSSSAHVGFESLLQEESAQSEALVDDWTSDEICRFKTVDPFDAQEWLDSSEESDGSSSSSGPRRSDLGKIAPGSVGGTSPSKKVTFGGADAQNDQPRLATCEQEHSYSQASAPLLASGPLMPSVFVMQAQAPMPAMGPGHAPMMWAYSPTMMPVANPVVTQQDTASMEQLPGSALGYRGEMGHRAQLSTPPTVAKESRSTWTCRMVRNLPNDYTRQDLLDLLDSHGVLYSFVYLPIDWRKRANLGYAFVTLISHEEAQRIAECLNGFSDWSVSSEKVCEVVWGKAEQQQLHRNIERFRNSPVMHPDVPEEYKPLLFAMGKLTAFPAPTRQLSPPRGFCATL